jgi:hypothetical protein
VSLQGRRRFHVRRRGRTHPLQQGQLRDAVDEGVRGRRRCVRAEGAAHAHPLRPALDQLSVRERARRSAAGSELECLRASTSTRGIGAS